jgi:multiple sugar transport system substrate-binding protein
MTVLHGMTWSHPRGYDPLVACASEWERLTGHVISWAKRSLQDFESFPVETLAREFDLIVLDHPHMGQVVGENCLVPFDMLLSAEALTALSTQFCGLSFDSYRFAGRQWALPIDAASQVQCYRADLQPAPASTWPAVSALVRQGAVMCPLRPPHALMAFFTLAANEGAPCRVDGEGPLIDIESGRAVFDRLKEMALQIDQRCFDMDPIDVYEIMAQPDSRITCAPLTFGYVNYGFAGFRQARLAFADIPASDHGVHGATLGGTGLAISAHAAAPRLAADFAVWVASDAVQRGIYASTGGQPAHGGAWSDPDVDNVAGGFYSSTRRTLEGAWMRPRLDGFMKVQDAASQRLSDGLRNGEHDVAVMAAINQIFGRATE